MPTPLNDAIRTFAREIDRPFDLHALLQGLVEHSRDVLDGVGAGILLQDQHGALHFAAATGDDVVRIERQQDLIEDGACHEAFTSDRIVAVSDLAVENRWPEYTARAVELGLGSVLGIPMRAGGQRLGVLNVYRDRPGPWSPEDLECGEVLATMGAVYLLNEATLRASTTLADQLQHALDARVAIEQARGFVAAERGVSLDEAFELLRTRARAEDRRLVEVAREILEHRHT
jgi:GAF domain-containing protein